MLSGDDETFSLLVMLVGAVLCNCTVGAGDSESNVAAGDGRLRLGGERIGGGDARVSCAWNSSAQRSLAAVMSALGSGNIMEMLDFNLPWLSTNTNKKYWNFCVHS